ncbi:MAG: 2OG-Fe(II) oxygenase [Hyphomicrobiaceae bacterium]
MTKDEPTPATDVATALRAGVGALDWGSLEASLDSMGVAGAGPLLTGAACQALVDLYANDEAFRSRIVMARHGFGSGEYKYLAYPLPDSVAALRAALYPRLAPIANRWFGRMGKDEAFPADHADFLARCHAAGQTRPTPLLLKYGPGDYNCLHQDLYGPLAFPIQAMVLLSKPGADFTGGEFVVVEQRPRMQSRAEVVSPGPGDLVLFAVNERPVTGTRGDYRVKMRHGVSRIEAEHATLGIIFHDAA